MGHEFLPAAAPPGPCEVELRGTSRSLRLACYTYAVDRARRYIECLAFVGIWMTIGWAFNLDSDLYLLVGIPLVAAFQLLVRRRPLVQLWVRRSRRFRVSMKPLVIGLMLFPGCVFVEQCVHGPSIPNCLWLLASMAGAVGVGYSVRRQKSYRARRAWRSFAAAVVIGVIVMGYAVAQTGRSRLLNEGHLATFLQQLALYFPVGFILEEVVFRGALDTHVYNRRGRPLHYWASAIFISVLWGLWHLPVIGLGSSLCRNAMSLVLVHVAIGVPLAICWRRSGTLLLPAAAHALIDAYRNTVLLQ